jgi:Zn-dependent M28 family amino/carboxypeptidase
MVGSPNYVIGVYNGSSLLDGGGAEELRTGGYGQALGSFALQKMYQRYIETIVGSPHVPVEFNGRSDYGPFLERGIACSGLETGAEGVKTEYERELFGGWANAWYDPCYHQFCDSIDNVSLEALAVNAPTAAYAVEFLGTHPQLDAFLGGIPDWTLPVRARAHRLASQIV